MTSTTTQADGAEPPATTDSIEVAHEHRDDSKTRKSSYRPDIQGLRALASLLVAVYHTWIGTVSGGVDVFFVVTGLLISGTLLGNVHRTGGVDALRFLRRLAGRLFPLAGLVLLVVIVGVVAFIPSYQWAQMFREIFASSTYWENWLLAQQATDYLAQDTAKSPVQHFWAMSVQGQFYVIWALVVAIAVGCSRRVRRLSFTTWFLVIVGVVSVASAAWALYGVATNPVFVYYDTFARLWEFGIGAAIAVFARGRTLPFGWRAGLGCMGLGMLLTAGFLPATWHYPGPVALWPALGAAALILSHQPGAERPGPVTRLLGSRPLAWLGGYSYGLYLWSWPMLIAHSLLFPDAPSPGLLGGLAVIGSAIMAAWLSIRGLALLQRGIEAVRGGALRRLQVPVATVLVPIAASAALIVPLQHASAVNGRGEDGVIDAEPFSSVEELQAEIARSMRATALPDLYPGFGMEGRAREWVENGCATVTEANFDDCRFDEGPSESAEILVIGDSQAISWVPGIRAATGGRVAVQAAGREMCPFSTTDVTNEWQGIDAHAACIEHNEWVLRLVEERQPALVVVSFGVWHGDRVIGAADAYDGMAALADGTRPYLQRLADLGVRTVWLDSPPSGLDMERCAIAKTQTQFRQYCRYPVLFEQLLRVQLFEAVSTETGVPYVSTLHWFCDSATLECPAMMRGMAVTADGLHITWGMAQALAPMLYWTLGIDEVPGGSRE